MRIDSPRPDEVKPVSLTPDATDVAEVSVLIVPGNTRV
jgi:ribonuclease PH